MAMNEPNTKQNVAFPRLDETEIAALKKMGTTRPLREGETLVEIGAQAEGFAGASLKIENYLGFPTGITGADLMGRALLQAPKVRRRVLHPFPGDRAGPGRPAAGHPDRRGRARRGALRADRHGG